MFFGRNIETIWKHINDPLNGKIDNSVVAKFTTTELFDLLRTNIIEEDDKVKLTYSLCGKRNPKEKRLDTKINKNKPTISLIDSLRKAGKIVRETEKYVSIKAYPGGNPNRDRTENSEDMIH